MGSSFLVFSLNNHPQGPYIATIAGNIDSPVQLQIGQWSHLAFTCGTHLAHLLVHVWSTCGSPLVHIW